MRRCRCHSLPAALRGRSLSLQMPSPNTVTTQYSERFSQRSTQLPVDDSGPVSPDPSVDPSPMLKRPQNVPSVVLSQKQALAVCIPAPFFCMMVQLTGHVRHTALTTVSQQQPLSRCHSDTAHTDVFERLPQLAELTEALLHHFVAPLVHSAVLVLRPSDGALHRLQPQNTTQLHTHGTHGIKQLHILRPSQLKLSPSGGC